MASLTLGRREPRPPPPPQEPPGPVTGPAPALSSAGESVGCPGPSPGRPAHRRLVAAEAVAALREPDEVLVLDPRGRLTPAQMVDQKLLALLQAGNPGLYAQAAGWQDLRRIRGGLGDAQARSLGP